LSPPPILDDHGNAAFLVVYVSSCSPVIPAATPFLGPPLQRLLLTRKNDRLDLGEEVKDYEDDDNNKAVLFRF
jgi:hypothetical protein